MTVSIFLTGATGYIGGDVLFAVLQAHPDYQVTCLVRNSDKGAEVASQYSKIKLVYGTLDDREVLVSEAQKADIVLNCADCDHEGAAESLMHGLAMHEADKPGFMIHTSGTGILTFHDTDQKTFGDASTKVYDDWDNVGEVTSLPDHAPHRLVDQIILQGKESNVSTAIVCPPTIYGVGRGPSKKRGHQLYELARCTLERKKGFQVGAGKTRWPNVHVYDMSSCYLKLVEAATRGGGKATWGQAGYYFTEHGEHVWGEISRLVATSARKQGFISSEDVPSVSAEDANGLTPMGSMLWAANSRCRAIRAREVLAWTPQEQSLEKEVDLAVESEAKRMGLVPGHASKVAG